MSSLERRPKERSQWHRGLLLYAMQGPEMRSQRAAARAVGVSEGGLRRWKKKFEWVERIEEAGDTAEQEAAALYRRHYHRRFGSREVAQVEDRMRIPLLPSDPVPDPDSPRTPPNQAQEAERRREAGDKTQRTIDDRLRQYTKAVDAGIAAVIRRIQSKDGINASLADLPRLIKAQIQINDYLDPRLGDRERTEVPVESQRVRQARREGGDLLEALREDHREQGVILEVLTADREGADGLDEQPGPRGEVVELPRGADGG